MVATVLGHAKPPPVRSQNWGGSVPCSHARDGEYPGAAEFARHGHSMAISHGNDRLQPTACHKPEFVNGLNSRSHKERYHRERRTHQEQRIDGLPTSLNIIYNWLWYVIVYIIQSLFASKVIWHQICSGVGMVVADGLAFNIPLSWCHAA